MRNAVLGRRFNVTVFGGDVTQNRRKKGRLAAAVGADKTDAFALTRRQRGMAVKHARAAGKRKVE